MFAFCCWCLCWSCVIANQRCVPEWRKTKKNRTPGMQKHTITARQKGQQPSNQETRKDKIGVGWALWQISRTATVRLWWKVTLQPLWQCSIAQCSRCQLGCFGGQNLPCSIYRRIIRSCSYCMQHAASENPPLSTTGTNYPPLAKTPICSG